MKLIAISILFISMSAKATFLETPSASEAAQFLFSNFKEKINTLKRDNSYVATANRAEFSRVVGCRSNTLVITLTPIKGSLQIDSFCNQTDESFKITTVSDSPLHKMPLLEILKFDWVKDTANFSLTSKNPHRKLEKTKSENNDSLNLEYSKGTFIFDLQIKTTYSKFSKVQTYEAHEGHRRVIHLKRTETPSSVPHLKNYLFFINGKSESHKDFLDSYTEVISNFIEFFL